jgi:hypothetical protein
MVASSAAARLLAIASRRILQVHPYSGYYRFCLVAGQRNAASWYGSTALAHLPAATRHGAGQIKEATAPIAEPRRTSRLKAITPPVVDRTSLSGSLVRISAGRPYRAHTRSLRQRRQPFVKMVASHSSASAGSRSRCGQLDRSTVSERRVLYRDCRWCTVNVDFVDPNQHHTRVRWHTPSQAFKEAKSGIRVVSWPERAPA